MNTQAIKSFVTPEAIVQITKLVADTQKKHFTATLGIKEKGKRKFILQEIQGTMTSELSDWLSKAKAEKIKIVDQTNERGFRWVPNGSVSTGFQRLCEFRGESGGKLHEMIFECENKSENRAANPFRLIMLDGKNILTLVNVAKRRRTESIDPQTGSKSIHYSVRFGRLQSGAIVPAFIKPSDYRRLVIQSTQTVELYTEQPATAENRG